MQPVSVPASFLLLGLLEATGLAAGANGQDRLDELPQVHRDWINKEVVYIITDREKEVFLALESMQERERFIEAFWKRRDTNRTTPQNEFKDEHYRRLEYANQFLGRETYLEGWQTDRGRYYIILGEPREIQRFDGFPDVVPIELWFYQPESGLGLPAFFYLLFFKERSVGDYRIYSPAVDTPVALFSGGYFTPGSDNIRVVEALAEISPELATASLSFDTSEPPDFVTGRPAMGTEILLGRIADAPKRAVRGDYAEAWLRDRGRVSADYSFNFVPSRASFAVLADPSGTPLVHYTVEIDPQNFSLETDEAKSKFYTTLELTVEARTLDGTLVLANDSEAYIELTPSQMQTIYQNPFAYQNDFPLLPGDYTISVIVRNRVLHQYTLVEREVHVPDFRAGRPVISDVIAAFGLREVPGDFDEGDIRTFQIGSLQLQPSADNVFVIGDTIRAVAQAFGAKPEETLVFELRNEREILSSVQSPIGGAGLAVAEISLSGFVGGTYDLVARLASSTGETMDEKRAPITVSPRSTARRPVFVLKRGVDTAIPGLVDMMLGEQYWNLERLDEARAAFRDAVASGNPQLVPARWWLARVHLRQERPDEALELLLPLERAFPDRYEILSGIGLAAHLKGENTRAVDYLERAMKMSPPDTLVLNALGESHRRLGNTESARRALERSLALDPEQPEIEKALRALPPAGN